MNRPKFYIYLPIVFALVLILGIFIGSTFNLRTTPGTISVDGNGAYSKIDQILKYVEEQYVDTIKTKDLVDKTIVSLLANLDPHSSYITAEELIASNEPLLGNFEGIGVEFNIVEDTIRVIAAIPGGPSELVGVQAGDKIIKVDGKVVAGIKITNKQVMENLKGKGGTKVKVSMMRRGKRGLLDFVITRGTIPIHSIDVSYMVNPKTGYIKISRFGATTYDEYMQAFEKLRGQGMQQLIIDLRGNGGGFLNSAVDIADELLSEGKEIVYTIGKARPRKDYKATRRGEFENGKLMVLIDDGSASASEILAGALQDNDRATIIGRRSFGKGLVQEQSEFSDSSAIRLTIARYYTPTGRSIQKSYADGVEAYYEEENNRYANGELENADSIKITDSIKFTTPAGKIVYGGGGIIPDVFVGLDTAGRSLYLTEVFFTGTANDFAFEYADRERTKLKSYKTVENFNKSFVVTPAILEEFIAYAEKNKIKRNNKEIAISQNILKNQLKALIARNIFNGEGYYQVIQTQDNVLKKAIELMK
ncbi:MAG: PDZ domain-containing protein [Bacteroidetes bacterium]|nr:PDZ domain-containing protein [Bacteroidota bacterium]